MYASGSLRRSSSFALPSAKSLATSCFGLLIPFSRVSVELEVDASQNLIRMALRRCVGSWEGRKVAWRERLTLSHNSAAFSQKPPIPQRVEGGRLFAEMRGNIILQPPGV